MANTIEYDEIQIYDTFKYNGDEIIEATGLTRWDVDEQKQIKIFKNVNGVTRKPGEILNFSKYAFESSDIAAYEWVYHPLCREVGRMFKKEVGFAGTLIGFLDMLWKGGSDEDRKRFSQVLREKLSPEIKSEIVNIELCDSCDGTVIKY